MSPILKNLGFSTDSGVSSMDVIFLTQIIFLHIGYLLEYFRTHAFGAVQEVHYFSASLCIFSRFVETVRKYRNKEDVRTSFSNFSDIADSQPPQENFILGIKLFFLLPISEKDVCKHTRGDHFGLY